MKQLDPHFVVSLCGWVCWIETFSSACGALVPLN